MAERRRASRRRATAWPSPSTRSLIDNRGDVAVVDLAGQDDRHLGRLGGHLRPRTGRPAATRSGSARRAAAARRPAPITRSSRRRRAAACAPWRARRAASISTTSRPTGACSWPTAAGGRRSWRSRPDATEESELTWMDFSWVADICGRRQHGAVRRAGRGRRPGLRRVPARHGPVAGRAPRQGHGAVALARRAMGARHRSRAEHAAGAADRRRRAPRPAIAGHQGLLVGRLVSRRQAHRLRRVRGRQGTAHVRARTWPAARSGRSRPRASRSARTRSAPTASGSPRGRTTSCSCSRSTAASRAGDGAEPGGPAARLARRRPRAVRASGQAAGAGSSRSTSRPASGRSCATIAPRDTVGVDAIGDMRMTPDGKSYAYVYIRSLYSLYQVTGLK